mmetsp:Transcript_21140/g.18750  ORF Transcript_21140/g.18750 Transcript_21140/m.18750 type:complete len:270 (+) Transcript_21140:906-1715(+)
MESEEEQTNLLAQHEKSIKVTKNYVVEKEIGEMTFDDTHGVKAELMLLKKKKESTTTSTRGGKIEYRKGSYAGEVPVILSHAELGQSMLDAEPNRKMIKPIVIDYKRVHSDIEFIINIEYLDGNNWEIIKSSTEILNHRKRVSRKHQQLKIPVISHEDDFDDEMGNDKRKYEIQAYLDFLLNSKLAYKALLDLIEYKRNSRNSYKDVDDSKDSLFPNISDKKSNKKSELSINYDEDGPAQLLGDSFVDEEQIFLNSGLHGNLDDSDEDF